MHDRGAVGGPWDAALMGDELQTRVFYERDKLHIEVQYDNAKGLTFYGQDLGGWAGTSEYEYWVSVDGRELRAALNADAGSDLGDLVCARVDEIMECGETSWLTAHGIRHTVDTRYEFPD
jgi:hypothetical protein